MIKLTVLIEDEPKQDSQGYESRETLARLSVEVPEYTAWGVYADSVAAVTQFDVKTEVDA